MMLALEESCFPRSETSGILVRLIEEDGRCAAEFKGGMAMVNARFRVNEMDSNKFVH